MPQFHHHIHSSFASSIFQALLLYSFEQSTTSIDLIAPWLNFLVPHFLNSACFSNLSNPTIDFPNLGSFISARGLNERALYSNFQVAPNYPLKPLFPQSLRKVLKGTGSLNPITINWAIDSIYSIAYYSIPIIINHSLIYLPSTEANHSIIGVFYFSLSRCWFLLLIILFFNLIIN